MDTPTCNWQGQSGETYRYWVYALPASFGAGQAGNYIYARTDNQGYWAPIYIGQGDLSDRVDSHHQAHCIHRKGASHLHCHKNSDERARRLEEFDLLGNYTQAYQPNGCNERLGG